MADRRGSGSRTPVCTPGRPTSITPCHSPSTLSDYRVLQTLGKGSFGTVSKIMRIADREALVWKEVGYQQMNDRDKSQLVREVNLLKDLKHPHIVRYVDRIVDKASMRLFIVMSYCVNGDLDQVLKRHAKKKEYMSEDTILGIFSQLVDAVACCHSRKPKIIHRDIKPSNVFLDEKKRVKLGDFGLARILEEGHLASTNVGTPYYQSPEILMGQDYDDKSDIWALGCILYELAMLEIPFQATSYQALTTLVQKGTYRPVALSYGPDLRHLVHWTLRKDPSERPTAEELVKTQVLNWRIQRSHALEGFEDNSRTRKLEAVPQTPGRLAKCTSQQRHESHTPRTQRLQDRTSPRTQRHVGSIPPRHKARTPCTTREDDTPHQREHATACCTPYRNIATPCRALSTKKRVPPAYADENLAPRQHNIYNADRALTAQYVGVLKNNTLCPASCEDDTPAPLHHQIERSTTVHITPYHSDITRDQRLNLTPFHDNHQAPRTSNTLNHEQQTSVATTECQPEERWSHKSSSTVEEKKSSNNSTTASIASREHELLQQEHELRKREMAVRSHEEQFRCVRLDILDKEEKLAKREDHLLAREKAHTREVAQREEHLRAREQSLYELEAALRRREERLCEKVNEMSARDKRDFECHRVQATPVGTTAWMRHPLQETNTIMEADKLPERKTPQSVIPTISLCGMRQRSRSLAHFAGRGHAATENVQYIVHRAF
eukprot:GEMP01021207.1.p1 GENE.GEMP01021207.1~~GEMP01021207.1.p1  ORF type:complete len:722 (+),score=169.85 GEMP01021207.1:100-2265(+)